MPLKFLGRMGNGSTAAAIEAINYVVDRKKHGVNVRIISASWGSNSNSKALEDAIRAAGDAGILFVAAAGNDGSNNDQMAALPVELQPAKPDQRRGTRSERRSGVILELRHKVRRRSPLPERRILSTWLGDGYREASGTSMATPYVSGVAASGHRKRAVDLNDRAPQTNPLDGGQAARTRRQGRVRRPHLRCECPRGSDRKH